MGTMARASWRCLRLNQARQLRFALLVVLFFFTIIFVRSGLPVSQQFAHSWQTSSSYQEDDTASVEGDPVVNGISLNPTPPPSKLVTISSNDTVCVRNVGQLPVLPRSHLPSQAYFLPGLKSKCWLEELNPLDLHHLSRGSILKKGSLINRTAMYAPYATDPPSHLWLRCLPYFYLLGAAKSGTTDLYRRIRMHPDVYYPKLHQDPNWWNIRRFVPASRGGEPLSLAEYVDMLELLVPQLTDTEFCHDDPEQPWVPDSNGTSGDNSPFYLHTNSLHHEALLRRDTSTIFPPLGVSMAAGLAAFQPEARLIAIVREPADRLFSDYVYTAPNTDAHKSGERFHAGVLHAIQLWNNCTATYSEQRCARDRHLKSGLGIISLEISLYVVHVQRWLDEFPRSQLLILRTEDYARDMNATLTRSFHFLQLEQPEREQMDKIIKPSKMNARRASMLHVKMLPETRQLLTKFFRPYNQRLAKLLKSNDFLWEDVGS